MADTVNISKIANTVYTWNTYTETWLSAPVVDSWESAAPFSWTTGVSVLLGIAETPAPTKSIVKGSFNESLTFTEHITKQYIMQQAVSLSFSEVFDRVYNIVKAFNESLVFTEDTSKNIIIPIEEAFAFIEFISRLPSATFSDISIFNTPLTLTQFQDLVDSGSPAGFEQFKKFLPGDYAYRYAKVKAILTTLSNDTPVLDNLKVIVDVADIHNKGTAVIISAASGIAVTFDRPYNAGNPNVILAFKGGIGGVATPEISSESLTGFTVKLIDNTGTYVTGSVTWASDGY